MKTRKLNNREPVLRTEPNAYNQKYQDLNKISRRTFELKKPKTQQSFFFFDSHRGREKTLHLIFII
jgi:hypothetical protein